MRERESVCVGESQSRKDHPSPERQCREVLGRVPACAGTSSWYEPPERPMLSSRVGDHKQIEAKWPSLKRSKMAHIAQSLPARCAPLSMAVARLANPSERKAYVW